jgi:NAD(P)-dependent dehydrogenase (short-subunit alcohol dehydrogenase family)
MTVIIVDDRQQEEPMKLAGKKALITGGNSGIGLATARLFVSEGAEVAITGRDQRTLDEAVAELGSKAHGYRVDVTVAEDRKKLFAELAKDFGNLDIVFANAGISGRTPTGTTDEAVFENVVHTNLNGAFFTVNSTAPLMNDNGSIIFNGSVHNYLGQPGVAAYAATKGGLVSMAQAVAADLAPRRIRVNVVAPGATKTPIWKRGPRANATQVSLISRQFHHIHHIHHICLIHRWALGSISSPFSPFEWRSVCPEESWMTGDTSQRPAESTDVGMSRVSCFTSVVGSLRKIWRSFALRSTDAVSSLSNSRR